MDVIFVEKKSLFIKDESRYSNSYYALGQGFINLQFLDNKKVMINICK